MLIPQELTACYDFVDTGKVDASDAFVKYLDTRVEQANNKLITTRSWIGL